MQHMHARWFQFQTQLLRKAGDRVFGGRIRSHITRSKFPGQRSDVDDAATRGGKQRQRLLCAANQRQDIQIPIALKVGKLCFGNRPARRSAGTIYEHIQPAAACLNLLQ